jgi:hypothetical protein
MSKVINAVHRLEQILAGIVEARLPMSVWLDFAALNLYRKRP